MYHLGHSEAGPPMAPTQGMNNISPYPPPPDQEADFLPLLFHMKLIAGL